MVEARQAVRHGGAGQTAETEHAPSQQGRDHPSIGRPLGPSSLRPDRLHAAGAAGLPQSVPAAGAGLPQFQLQQLELELQLLELQLVEQLQLRVQLRERELVRLLRLSKTERGRRFLPPPLSAAGG